MSAGHSRSEATRATLMAAFREAFLRQGFEAATIQDALTRTGLSKGAFYHHFESKLAVMAAIYDEESRRAIERALARIDDAASPLDRLRTAFLAWIDEVRSPDASRLLFEVGPSALGAQRAKAIENENSLRRIEALLREAVASGALEPLDEALTAAMLNALAAEAALFTLRTGRDASAALDRGVRGLLGQDPSA